METLIWLTEVAPKGGKREKELLERMAAASDEANPGIDRLILHGKGRKDCVEFLQNGEREILGDWLKIRGSESGPMFYS